MNVKEYIKNNDKMSITENASICYPMGKPKIRQLTYRRLHTNDVSIS